MFPLSQKQRRTLAQTVQFHLISSSSTYGMPRLPSLWTPPPAPKWGPQGVPRPAEWHGHSSVSLVFPGGGSSRWGMPGTHLPREECMIQILMWRSSSSPLSSSQVSPCLYGSTPPPCGGGVAFLFFVVDKNEIKTSDRPFLCGGEHTYIISRGYFVVMSTPNNNHRCHVRMFV